MWTNLAMVLLVCGISMYSVLWWAYNHAPQFPYDEDS